MTPDRDPIVARFRELYSEEFGESIDEREASERLTRLTNVLRILFPEPTDTISRLTSASLDDSPESGRLKAH